MEKAVWALEKILLRISTKSGPLSVQELTKFNMLKSLAIPMAGAGVNIEADKATVRKAADRAAQQERHVH